jgi:hypothetical protein
MIRDDILPAELTQEQIRMLVNMQFQGQINRAQEIEKSRAPGVAKNLNEFYGLVKEAIDHREAQENKIDDAKVCYTQDFADVEQHLEGITFSLIRREPGRFSEGAPFEGSVKNLRSILREIKDDPNNPGYKIATFGKWYDNVVRFTCWARTNSEANKRALWFEDLMEDYAWFFTVRGVPRVIFWSRDRDVMEDTTQSTASTTNKYYGRPLDFYVKTERIRNLSEKTLEKLIINVNVSNE